MKKLLLIAMWLCSYVAMLPVVSFAQVDPTATPTTAPGAGFTPACDPCGFCVGGDKPANWDQCSACLQSADYTWTVLGCIPSSPGGFTQTILKTAVTMIGGVAFLALLYGGFLLLTSSGDIRKINKGKTIVASAIVGLLMILFSVFILRTIGYEILRIPGFGG